MIPYKPRRLVWKDNVLQEESRTEERDMIRTVQGWCPECGGSGMVMRFSPEDCPNLDIHVLLDRFLRQEVKP